MRSTEGLRHQRNIKRLDEAVMLISIAGPIMTLPQLWLIWVQQNVSGISVISWMAYLVISAFWIAYGYVHKEWTIIIPNTIWVVLDACIIAGVLLHG